jgi:hypothetical protein
VLGTASEVVLHVHPRMLRLRILIFVYVKNLTQKIFISFYLSLHYTVALCFEFELSLYCFVISVAMYTVRKGKNLSNYTKSISFVI